MKLTVRAKLLGGFLGVIALMVVVGVVALTRIDALGDVTTSYRDDTVPSVAAAAPSDPPPARCARTSSCASTPT